MLIKRKHLPRRSFICGIGATVALPFLDAMVSALCAATALKASPNRLIFTYIPSGAMMNEWTPQAEGKDYQFGRILQPLERYRQQFSILSGLDHKQAEAMGDGPWRPCPRRCRLPHGCPLQEDPWH